MDNKTLFAKQCIAEALITLIEEKEYQDISVTEICKIAGFSRMAYYRNFTNKDEILMTYMFMLVDSFVESAKKKLPSSTVISYDYLLFAFQFFKGYKRFVDVLLKANLISVLQTGLNYYMDRYLAGTDADMTMRYQMYYYAGGICNLFTIWISRGMQESCEEMAQIIYDRFNHPSFAHK